MNDREGILWLKALAHTPIDLDGRDAHGIGGHDLPGEWSSQAPSLWPFIEGTMYRRVMKYALRGELRPPYTPPSRIARRMLGLRSRLRRLVSRSEEPRPGGILAASAPRAVIGLDEREEDLFLPPVLRELDNRHGRVPITLLHKFPTGNGLSAPIPKGWHGAVTPWEFYEDRDVRESARRTYGAFNVGLDALIDSESFRRAAGVHWPAMRLALHVVDYEVMLTAYYLAVSYRIMGRLKPKVLLVASELSLDNKALIAAARSQGIPVIALQAGSIIATDNYQTDYGVTQDDLKSGWRYLFPDQLALFDTESKRVLLDEIGYPYPDRLVVTGQPRFERLARNYRLHEDAHRAAFEKRFKLPPNEKRVLIASQTFNYQGSVASFANLVLAGLAQSDYHVVVKPHPLEDPKRWERWGRAFRMELTVLPPTFDVQDAILACDAVVTSYSTVALEAMLAGRPVATVNDSGKPDLVPYAREGAAVSVTTATELSMALRQLVTEQSALREKTLTRAHAYTNPMQHVGASERVAELVIKAAYPE